MASEAHVIITSVTKILVGAGVVAGVGVVVMVVATVVTPMLTFSCSLQFAAKTI